VVDPKRIIGKKWRPEEEERHKGLLTQKKCWSVEELMNLKLVWTVWFKLFWVRIFAIYVENNAVLHIVILETREAVMKIDGTYVWPFQMVPTQFGLNWNSSFSMYLWNRLTWFCWMKIADESIKLVFGLLLIQMCHVYAWNSCMYAKNQKALGEFSRTNLWTGPAPQWHENHPRSRRLWFRIPPGCNIF
jgi:hypothetical protein